MKGYHYEMRQEECESYGTNYISYAIVTQEEQAAAIWHDVTANQEEAAKLCTLLNKHELEPEQAGYVIEDYIIGQYLVEA